MKYGIAFTLLLVSMAAGCIQKSPGIISAPDLAAEDTVLGEDGAATEDTPNRVDTAPDGTTPTDAATDTPQDTPVDAPVDAALDTPPDADPCAEAVCGDGECTKDCEDNSSCPDDCCKCGDGSCDIFCGEWAANCQADCCVCGDGKCSFSSCPGESAEECPDDCGDYVCGDGDCDPGESPITCGWDCGDAACGNGECEPGENPDDCPYDCTPFACGNQICEEGENPEVCPIDCASDCGDCVCDEGETWNSCATDCGWCGDAHCSSNCGDESFMACPQDCCVDGNPCTEDVFAVVDDEVKCSFTPLTGTNCDDACSEGETGACDAGFCVCSQGE